MTDVESELHSLVRGASSHLQRLGYSETSRNHYAKVWRSLLRFAESEGFAGGFSPELAVRYLASRGLSPDISVPGSYQRTVSNGIRILGEFSETGSFRLYRRATPLPSVPHALSGGLFDYGEFCTKHLGHSPVTLEGHQREILHFLHFVDEGGVSVLGEIQADHVADYLSTRGHLGLVSLQGVRGKLRAFLRHLFARGILAWEPDECPAIPRFASRHKLPSVFPRGVVEAILAAVDRSTSIGKRNYAILLLACRLGLRVGDIRTLRLDDISWGESLIRIQQQKTGRPLCLPLDDDTGEALIDYLHHGRPRTEDREVFLKARAPVGPLTSGNSLWYVIAPLLEKAGVELPAGTKRGLHSLRHTLATRMLEAGEPLETIAEVLGHRSVETTRIYVEVDTEALRSVALDPDEVHHG